MEQVVITGMGVISSLGIGRDAFWRSLCRAQSGIRRIDHFDTSSLRCNVAGFVGDFDPGRFLKPMVYRRMSRTSRMAVCASIEALRDSRIQLDELDRDRVAIVMGTAYGSSSHVDAFFASLLENGPRGAQPFLFPETVPNAAAGHMAIYHGITGPNSTFCQNEISAETAMAYAVDLLRRGQVDVALVAGAEELSEILFVCYDAVGALNPTRVTADDAPVAPIPGAGHILGEGAACLVLENKSHAARRGAGVYGRLDGMALAGGGAAMDRYEWSGEELMNAVHRAMDEAGTRRQDIGALNVAANYSKELDRIESRCFSDFFSSQPHLAAATPLKYLTGSFGAAGVTRAAAILLSLRHRSVLPAVPLRRLDSGQSASIRWIRPQIDAAKSVLMSSATFGGGAAALIFSGCDRGS